jgi:hypothetical protein
MFAQSLTISNTLNFILLIITGKKGFLNLSFKNYK